MPSKRTNDSVEAILQQLDREQAAESVRDQMTDRQVDDILRSVGMLNTYQEEKTQPLGPLGQDGLPDLELGGGVRASHGTADRFATDVLEDLLADLPSLQSAAAQPAARARQTARPAPAPQPAPAPRPAAPVTPASEAPAPAPAQPEPAQAGGAQDAQPSPAMETGGLGDTTRTGIIKNFLLKMVPGAAEADQNALNQGKNEFQRFFGQSAAVVPGEHSPRRDDGKKRRGLFGLGRAEDEDEFVPINVSLTRHEELPEPEEDTQDDGAQQTPHKPGLLGRLLGTGKKEEQPPQAEELYPPEPRDLPPQPVQTDTAPVQTDAEEPERIEPTMQIPRGAIRSKYTAGRGAGLDTQPLPADPEPVPEPQDAATAGWAAADWSAVDLDGQGTEGSLRLDAPEDDPLAGLLPGASTLSFIQEELKKAREGSERAARAAAPAAGPIVHRKKRTTVEFVPRRPGDAREPAVQMAPEPRYGSGPVGEPVMTPSQELPRVEESAPAEPAAPQPAATGFTQQIDPVEAAVDTQVFLQAYDQARELHKGGASARAGKKGQAAPAHTGHTGEVDLAAPAHTGHTGEVDLGTPGAQESDFVRGIERSINRQPDAGTTGTGRDEEYYSKAASILTDTGSAIPGKGDAQPDGAALAPEKRARGFRLRGVPADERETGTLPPFLAVPPVTRHGYDKPEDAPAVSQELARQELQLTVAAIICGAAFAVLLYLSIAAFSAGVPLPAALDLAADKRPLLAVMLALLAVACGVCWRTLAEGWLGLLRSPTPDSMPALAATGALVQLIVFLIWPQLYDASRFTLVTGSAALLLCLNTVGKAMDAHTLRAEFEMVSSPVDHAVARRLMDSGMLQAATRGLSEARPCVLVSRPTELFKGFLNSAGSHRTSDKSQQQFAWGLGICALLSVAFTLIYHRDPGKAVTALAAVLCLGAPLAGTLLSALPAQLMQRSAAQVGAVIPGWHDIRQLGRINVICVTARDLFPEGSILLNGIKPVRQENIDRAITYAASMMAEGGPNLRKIFMNMVGNDRRLLARVEERETIYGQGCVGWIDGERVLMGNRRLMEAYGVQLPSLEYEQRHTLNQRRFIYLAVSGKLFGVFQISYQRDPDTAAVLESLRHAGISLVVDGDDFNCDEALLQAVYGLPSGAVKVLTAQERETLEPATAWLPESEGNMLHLGSFASFVGGLEAAAGAAEGERRASAVVTASVLFSWVLALILSAPKAGITALPLPALVLYQAAWAVLALIFPLLQRY